MNLLYAAYTILCGADEIESTHCYCFVYAQFIMCVCAVMMIIKTKWNKKVSNSKPFEYQFVWAHCIALWLERVFLFLAPWKTLSLTLCSVYIIYSSIDIIKRQWKCWCYFNCWKSCYHRHHQYFIDHKKNISCLMQICQNATNSYCYYKWRPQMPMCLVAYDLRYFNNRCSP